MMENEYILSDLSRKESIELIKDLLNHRQGLNLVNAEINYDDDIDLIQFNSESLPEIIVIIKSPQIKESISRNVIKLELDAYNTSKLERIIFVDFEPKNEALNKSIKKIFNKKYPQSKFDYYDVNWIIEQIKSDPQITA